MTHPAMDTDALRRVAEAHHVAGAAMYRLADAIKEMGDVTQPAVQELPAVPAAEKEAEPKPNEWRGEPAWWATSTSPAPTAPPPSVVAGQEAEPKPEPEAPPEHEEPHTGGWIVDWLPDAKDSNDEARGHVRIPQRLGTPLLAPGEALLTCHWSAVQPGQPWAWIYDSVDPWDPTCLDRNGWIRSRLPTVEDANSTGLVLLPMGNGGVNSAIAYALIVPGQPWAPWGSNPGRFEK